jgi:hypothetical protein
MWGSSCDGDSQEAGAGAAAWRRSSLQRELASDAQVTEAEAATLLVEAGISEAKNVE